jgi:hypothetical protein
MTKWKNLVVACLLFPGYRPAGKPWETALATSSRRCTEESHLEKDKATGFRQGTEIAVDQFGEHVIAMK